MFSIFRRILALMTLCMLLVVGAVAQNNKSTKKTDTPVISKKIIPQATYDKIKDVIIAKQPLKTR
jgi:hypothetical protein